MSSWFVYLLECRDGSLYTGITTDVDRRFAQHVAGAGARYTRSHPPLRLLGYVAHVDRAAASRAEYAIKQLSPAHKRALCASWREQMADAEAPSIALACSAPAPAT